MTSFHSGKEIKCITPASGFITAMEPSSESLWRIVDCVGARAMLIGKTVVQEQ
jgi:hypothetical protein